MRLVLLVLLVASTLAAAQPDGSGRTETTLTADDVVVTPRGAQPVPVLVAYEYVPAAAATAKGPTRIVFSFDVGKGLLLEAENETPELSVPVSATASPPTGAVAEAQLPLRVYCHHEGRLTFPVGNASFIVRAEAQANGLLQPSRGEVEVRVECRDEAASPPATTTQTGNATMSTTPPAPADEKDAPWGPLAIVAVALAALTRRAWRAR